MIPRWINERHHIEIEVYRSGEIYEIGTVSLKSGDAVAIPWGESPNDKVQILRGSRSGREAAVLDTDA